MIFFDIDDTLMNNTAAELEAASQFFDLHRNMFQKSRNEFVKHWRAITEINIQRYLSGELTFQGQRRERLRRLFIDKKALSDDEADVIFDTYLGLYENSWTLFADVVDCLNDLNGHPLGIITNGDAFQQKQKLVSLGIADRFSTIVISGEVGMTKPDAKIFHLACRKAGVNPSDCWHIGDDINADVRGSNLAGMKAVWLNRSGNKQLTGITTIESLQDLKKILDHDPCG
jgi:putative hydrolase of the HAD superfamily